MPEKNRLMQSGLFNHLESMGDCSYSGALVKREFAVGLCFGEFS
jgi:hypothetical protein